MNKWARTIVALLPFVLPAFAVADDAVTRKGLEPAMQSKVTRVMARDRLLSSPGDAASNAAALADPDKSACGVDIGNVDVGKARPGVAVPKETIVVIKSPIVNRCR